jgi:hypothetical protein
MEKKSSAKKSSHPSPSSPQLLTPVKSAPRRRKRGSQKDRTPFQNSLHVFWSSGALGGLMMIGAIIWAIARGPVTSETVAAAPVIPVAQSVPSVFSGPFEQATALSTGDRVAFWSGYLATHDGVLKEIGTPPVLDDIVAVVPSHLDCTTFVESVLALARSEGPDQFFDRLIAVRYKNAHPGYLSRNHFPETDWIPNNESAGIITDITLRLATARDAQSKTVAEQINRGAWLAKKERKGEISRKIASVPDVKDPERMAWSVPVETKVTFIPVAELSKILGEIPNGTIINFVHENDGRHPGLITHQGIVVKEKGEVLLRHASPEGPIKTVVLSRYLRRSTQIVGFTLNQVNP